MGDVKNKMTFRIMISVCLNYHRSFRVTHGIILDFEKGKLKCYKYDKQSLHTWATVSILYMSS